jgi:hypothetical protein
MALYARDRERQFDIVAFGYVAVVAVGLRLHSGVHTLHFRISWARRRVED